MFRTTSFAASSTNWQSLIDVVDEDKVGGGKSGGNETNLSNPSALKKSTRAGYVTSKGAKIDGENPKRGSGNTKKGVKADRDSNYLIPDIKKTFNYLRHAFIQALIFYYFDPEYHI